MTRILVSGATGYVGSALLELLNRCGDEGYALSRTENRKFLLPVGVPSCTIEEARGMDTPFEAIVHLAYGVGLGTSDTLAINRNIINSLMSLAAAHSAKFIHASTIAVFGYCPPSDTNFVAPLTRFRHDDVYTYVKGQLEQHVMRVGERYKVPCSIVRIGNVLGPASLWARIVTGNAARQDAFLSPGGVSNSTSILNLTELLHVEAKASQGSAILLSSEFARTTWRSWAEAIIPDRLKGILRIREFTTPPPRSDLPLISSGLLGLQQLIMNQPRLKRWVTSLPGWILKTGKETVSVPAVGDGVATTSGMSQQLVAVLNASHGAPEEGCKIHSFEETTVLIREWAIWANYFAEYDR